MATPDCKHETRVFFFILSLRMKKKVKLNGGNQIDFLAHTFVQKLDSSTFLQRKAAKAYNHISSKSEAGPRFSDSKKKWLLVKTRPPKI